MKLYTEEQVKRIITHFYQMDHLLTDRNIEKSIDSVTPIEIPSDEDEEKAAFSLTKNLQQHMGFNIGAKWMRNKIQGANNENL